MGQAQESAIDDGRAKFISGHPKKLTNSQRLRIALKHLRTSFPAAHPVKVRRKKILPNDVQGYAYLATPRSKDRKPYFVVYIATSGMPWQQQFDTLIHEWAHIYTWYEVMEKGESDHGPIWTKAYGKIYRELIED
jgi:hypothetical protein